MTFRQLLDKLKNVEPHQLDVAITCFNKFWFKPETDVDLCFDPQSGEPYFYVTTDREKNG
jgi:hypothetical protein